MKAEELLRPRFEVIATYPKSNFKEGDILERIPNATNNWYNHNKSIFDAQILMEEIVKYPHLFKKLEWWEYRKEENMPKRVQSLMFPDRKPESIKYWDMENMIGIVDEKNFCSLRFNSPHNGYIPVD